MSRGRKPKPTAAKIAAGNPGKRAINKAEPKPPTTAPPCPEHLGEVARREWLRMVGHLEPLGLLTTIDGDALALYCTAYERWADAEQQLRKTGVIVKAPSGFPIQNPYLAIANKAMQQMQKLLVEFGCTPSSRSRISVEQQNKDALDDFLKLAV